MDSAPSTPPRRPRAAHPYTPKSVVRRDAILKNPKLPFDTPPHKPPMASPSSAKPASTSGSKPGTGLKSDSVLELQSPSALPGLAVFLPTPSTTGRTAKTSIFNPEPSTRSRGLTAALQEASETADASPLTAGLADAVEIVPKHETAPWPARKQPSPVLSSTPTPQTPARAAAPSTPPPHSINQQPTFDTFSDSVQIVPVEQLKHIKRYNMPNPFVGPAPPTSQPLRRNVDLSTHMETINHTTGERRLEQLTQEQMRFKPRKLEFSSAETVPVNYSLTNKLLAHSMGKTFTMGDYTPDSSQGFDIFEDE